ncbi:hypothetical protein [Methylobacterium sp. B1]|uniref:hypothetical protein n=1 Tax=Methylobacterium sp. B1 TaxID=91459 RepID=UPI002074750E|nr:hypothetical protein [Methylobacterium sp. B1]
MSLALAVPAGAGEDAFEGMAGPYGERLRVDAKGLTLTFPAPDVKLQIGGRLHIDGGAAGFSRPGPARGLPRHRRRAPGLESSRSSPSAATG